MKLIRKVLLPCACACLVVVGSCDLRALRASIQEDIQTAVNGLAQDVLGHLNDIEVIISDEDAPTP